MIPSSRTEHCVHVRGNQQTQRQRRLPWYTIHRRSARSWCHSTAHRSPSRRCPWHHGSPSGSAASCAWPSCTNCPPHRSTSPPPSCLRPSRLATRKAERAYLRRIQAKLREGGIRLSSAVTLTGDPGPALAQYAGEMAIDLVVMATHGRGGIRRAWLGSVADHLIRHLEVPVLLVRPTEGAAAQGSACRRPDPGPAGWLPARRRGARAGRHTRADLGHGGHPAASGATGTAVVRPGASGPVRVRRGAHRDVPRAGAGLPR